MPLLSLRQIRRRIKSVENTKKITRAMEMVAAAKLKRLQSLLADSDRYGGELRRILVNLLEQKEITHPLLQKREEIKRSLAFVVSSDTGLCGSYNTNIVTQTAYWIERAENANKQLSFVSIGKNGLHFLKRSDKKVIREFAIPRPQQIDDLISEITKLATESFIQNETDEVVFIYTKVESLSVLRPHVVSLFPLANPAGKESAESVDYILEPNLEAVLEYLLPEYIASEIGKFVKHALVAEQASRMRAMRQATDNAKEMIDSLTLQRNKARQASITKELIEVVSGSRALQMK